MLTVPNSRYVNLIMQTNIGSHCSQQNNFKNRSLTLLLMLLPRLSIRVGAVVVKGH